MEDNYFFLLHVDGVLNYKRKCCKMECRCILFSVFYLFVCLVCFFRAHKEKNRAGDYEGWWLNSSMPLFHN